MNTDNTAAKQDLSPDVKAGIRKRVSQIIFVVFLMGALMFISAGRLDWIWAWIYLAFYSVLVVINGVSLLRKNPELVAERAGGKEDTKDWDRRITRITASFWFLQFIIAGLDIRFGWTGGLPLWVHMIGALLLVAGNAFANWAMHTNAFFSTEVRIQEDRGQTVITQGPYQVVRHPGYTGFSVAAIGLPLFLGSLWALLPTFGMVAGMIVRTSLEDRTLQDELPGYKEYTAEVHYRLCPGVW